MKYIIVFFCLLSYASTTPIRRMEVESEVQCAARCRVSSDCNNWIFTTDKHCYWNIDNSDISFIAEESYVYRGAKNAVPNPIQHFVSRPVLLLPTTSIMHEADFYSGCSYTLSLWVYLFEEDLPTSYYSLFSVRPSRRDVVHPSLTPTIVTNLKPNPKKFFFSAMTDNQGNLEGFWSKDEVAFDEWMHITMVIDADRLRGYINGVLQKEVLLQLPAETCSMDMLAMHNSSFVHVGSRHGSKSLRGMIQDMVYLRHVALDSQQVRHLIESQPPIRFPTFTHLMSMRYLLSMECCAVMEEWETNDYLLISWGLCPYSLCGSTSIVEHASQIDATQLNIVDLLKQLSELAPGGTIDTTHLDISIAVVRPHRNIVQSGYFRQLVNSTLNSNRVIQDTNAFMGDINEADYFLYPKLLFPEDEVDASAPATSFSNPSTMSNGLWNTFERIVSHYLGITDPVSSSDELLQSSEVFDDEDDDELSDETILDGTDKEAMIMMHDIQFMYDTAMKIRVYSEHANDENWEDSADVMT